MVGYKGQLSPIIYNITMIYDKNGKAISLQPWDAATVTANDTTTFAPSTLYIGTAGNVNVTTAGGTTLVFSNLNAGTILPVLVTKVLLTSTTASNIVRLF